MVIQEESIKHYGVLGMKWGVRKDRRTGKYRPTKDILEDKKRTNKAYEIYGDGRIEIKKGTKLQRLATNENSKLHSGITYSSFTENDNNKYMKVIGEVSDKALYPRTNKLTLVAKEDLKSPSNEEAAKIFFDTLKKDPELVNEYNKTLFKTFKKLKPKHLEQHLEDPSSKKAYKEYSTGNTSLVFDNLPKTKKAYFKALEDNGYNMLRDENDVRGGLARNPVILLNGQKSAKITQRETINKQMKKDAHKYTKKNVKMGKDYLKNLGFKVETPLE